MQIPIRNVWLLQLFASDLYQSAGAQLADAEANPEQLPQLVATMLADEVAQRLHTGLTVGFTRTTRAVTRVRGRINALPTVRGQLLERGRVSCTFDEVVTDIPPNRLVRAALERAARLVPDVPRYRSLALQLEVAGVGAHCPPLSMVPSMRRQRLYARDRHMLAAAELLLTLMIPTTTEGDRMLPAAEMSDQYLRRLFEHAAYGFYKHRLEPGGWSVRHGEKLTWQTSHESGGMAELLPGMQLDITLQSPFNDLGRRRRIVIDTKFTSITKANQHGQPKLKSGYVYQIYAYLMSQRERPGGREAEGLMLHPSVGAHVDEEVSIQGHRIRFATVDLAMPPSAVTHGFIDAISAAPDNPNRVNTFHDARLAVERAAGEPAARDGLQDAQVFYLGLENPPTR